MTEKAAGAHSDDALPIVANKNPSNLGMWAFAIILLLGGVWLFSALSANRAQLQAPATGLNVQPDGSRISSPPPLALPREYLTPPQERRPRLAAFEPRVIRRPPISATPAVRVSQPSVSGGIENGPVTALPPAPPIALRDPPRPAVVFDNTLGPSAPTSNGQTRTGPQDRVSASQFVRPSQTIPQGTVIPAVLETALDSTRAGAARALVQRDIYSFDGSRVLIQRGSRLYGEYEAGLEAGQNRALIQWTRLIRPDGVTIALDSPSSDPLGRAGVKGKVDGKFFQRFGSAILQSVLDVGVGLATREVSSDGIVVALPGSTQNLQVRDQQQVQRTLKIKHGTSVSVFVARDLDFSSVPS